MPTVTGWRVPVLSFLSAVGYPFPSHQLQVRDRSELPVTVCHIPRWLSLHDIDTYTDNDSAHVTRMGRAITSFGLGAFIQLNERKCGACAGNLGGNAEGAGEEEDHH